MPALRVTESFPRLALRRPPHPRGVGEARRPSSSPLLQLEDPPLHERLVGARAQPLTLAYLAEAELLIAVAPHLDRFVAESLRHRGRVGRAARGPRRARAPLPREAQVRAAPRDAQDQGRRGRDARRRRARGRSRRAASAARFEELALRRAACSRGSGGRGRARRRRSPSPSASPRGPRTRRRDAGATAAACSSSRRSASTRCTSCPVRDRHAARATRCTRCTTSAGARASRSPIRAPDLAGALDEANYCIWCHEQGKDSCSKGLKEKPAADGDASPSRRAPSACRSPAARSRSASRSSTS